MPEEPIAASVCPLRHARPIVSVTDDGDGLARALENSGAQTRSARIRIHGEQRQFGTVDVGAVDARCGLHDSEFVLGDQSAALACHDADGFLIHQEASCRVALFRIGR